MSNIIAFKYFDDALAQQTTTPVHGSAEAAGVDIFPLGSEAGGIPTDCVYVILPGQTRVIRTNLCVRIPSGYYGRLAPRSSVSLRGLIINGGVIDADYRGELKVCVLNASKEPETVDSRKAICQLIIEHCIIVGGVKIVTTLDETARGDKGFGSTDIIDSIPESKRQKLEERMTKQLLECEHCSPCIIHTPRQLSLD